MWGLGFCVEMGVKAFGVWGVLGFQGLEGRDSGFGVWGFRV